MQPTPIFDTPAALPRGPHNLSREEVSASQRARLLAAMTELMAECGYAAVTIGDLAARAFIVHMDGAGPTARRRRQDSVHAFAAVIAQQHTTIREADPRLGPVPRNVYIALALSVRELVHDRLEAEHNPTLTDLLDDLTLFATATIEGAAAASKLVT